MKTIKCERCGEVLKPKNIKWLELSNTDGNYYKVIPKEHISQGLFSFGVSCAKIQIKMQDLEKELYKYNLWLLNCCYITHTIYKKSILRYLTELAIDERISNTKRFTKKLK